ncbi:hypothetical protein ACG94X_02490 [Acinetobacter sp. ULE_I010]|uniref:hypothetical protein n=1 Tax=Acinetobacter sp. ULE_I010 TaxID=3373065 RepID=UPI003AF7F86E
MKNTLNFLKEYLSVILIVPTIIGGLYQLINIIYNVGFSYVRYFSVAQVIPDGLLVGIFILYILLIVIVITELLRVFSISLDEMGGVKTKSLLIFMLLGILALLSWRFMTFNPDSNVGAILGDFGWLNAIIICVYSITMLVINLSITNDYKVTKFIYWVALTLYVIFFVYQFDSKIVDLNNNIIKDESFYNPNILINKMILKKPKADINFLYANRDYLFFSIEENGYKQILVEDAKKLTSLEDKKED